MFEGKMIMGSWTDAELRPNKLWVITSPLIWIRPNGKAIYLTPYLITDYASIPTWLWWMLPKRSIYYDIAAAFHDDCVRHYKLKNMSLQESHDVFKEIMKFYKAPKWQYTIMYNVVRSVGYFLRTNGIDKTPWKLTDQEKNKLKEIIENNPWVDVYQTVNNSNYDPAHSFCM